MHGRCLGAIILLLAMSGLQAQPQSATAESFGQCLAGIESLAVERGISAAVARSVLATVEPLERVIRADRSQPEFVQTFAAYMAARISLERIALGQRLYDEHRELLNELMAGHGVAGHYLLAFWALESNFGRYVGDIPVFDALSTLACDQRRSEYFTGELINALTMVDRRQADPASMVGSWAGAMGQTQFMPSAFLAHATDGDGDGRIDLWRSGPDALASAARYLESLGWVAGFRWGREVLLPTGFDFALAGRDRWRPLSDWRELGIRDTAGNPLGAFAIEAALVVPMGSAGPAFLIYENFNVAMRWNRSENFALVVGLLADRFAGSAGLSRPPLDEPPLTRDELAGLQEALTAAGFDAGQADGVLGSATRAAIRSYQQRQGLVADGYPAAALLEHLGLR
jgi:membrane-bound lytic murein transglycosylase B